MWLAVANVLWRCVGMCEFEGRDWVDAVRCEGDRVAVAVAAVGGVGGAGHIVAAAAAAAIVTAAAAGAAAVDVAAIAGAIATITVPGVAVVAR